MSQSNVINSTRLETLTKDNYDTWRIQAEALLIKSDMWDYVSGGKPAPEVQGATAEEQTLSQNALEEWKKQDRKARSDLILSISPSKLKQVKDCPTSKQIWDKLESIYASKGPARKAKTEKSKEEKQELWQKVLNKFKESITTIRSHRWPDSARSELLLH